MERSKYLIPYRKGNLWGYCNKTGEIILEPNYGLLTRFKYGLAYFSFPFDPNFNGEIKIGVFNSDLEIVLHPEDSKIEIQSRDIIENNKLPEDYKFNFFDAKKLSVEILPKRNSFTVSQKYSDKFLIGEKKYLAFKVANPINTRQGLKYKVHFLDESDALLPLSSLPNQIEPAIARYLIYIKIQFGIHQINDKCGYYSQSGKLTIPYSYDELEYCENGIFIARQENSFSLVSDCGVIITGDLYDYIIFLRNIRKWKGIISGEVYLIDVNPDLKEFVMGYDNSPSFEIVPNYEGPLSKQGPMVFLKRKKLFGLNIKKPYNSEKFSVLFPPCFESVKDLGYGFAKVELCGKHGVVDFEGVFTIPNIYDTIDYLGDNLFLVSVFSDFGTKYGVVGIDNQIHDQFNKHNIPFWVENLGINFYDIKVIPIISLGLIDVYFVSKFGEKFFFGTFNYVDNKKYWEGEVAHRFNDREDG